MICPTAIPGAVDDPDAVPWAVLLEDPIAAAVDDPGAEPVAG